MKTIATASIQELHYYADKYRALIGQINNSDKPDTEFLNKNLIVLATIVTEIRNRNEAK